eukprot:GGOE01018725.1.p1 GENE.GGOE01018725.1~~GGOE01018725.1.p1  ORF type:complete len:357 (-),score=47.41 GGOE01018725.1:205-1227(-)
MHKPHLRQLKQDHFSRNPNESNEVWGKKEEAEIVSVSLLELHSLRDQLEIAQQENSQLREQVRRLLDAEKIFEAQQGQQLTTVMAQLQAAGEVVATLEAKATVLQEEKDRANAERDKVQAALLQSQSDFEALLQRFASVGAIPSPPAPSSGLLSSTAVATNPHGMDLFLTPVHNVPAPLGHTQPLLGLATEEPRPPPHPRSPTRPSPPHGLPSPHGQSPPPPLRESPRPHVAQPPPVSTKQQAAPLAGMELIGILGLGIEMREGTHDADEGVVNVVDVRHMSLAEKAGLRIGDRIDKWNYRYIGDSPALVEALHKTAPGSRLRISFFRKGIRKHVLIDVP